MCREKVVRYTLADYDENMWKRNRSEGAATRQPPTQAACTAAAKSSDA